MKKPNIRIEKTPRSERDRWIVRISSAVLALLLIISAGAGFGSVIRARVGAETGGIEVQSADAAAVQAGNLSDAGVQADDSMTAANTRQADGTAQSAAVSGGQDSIAGNDAAVKTSGADSASAGRKQWTQNLSAVTDAYETLGIVQCSGYINLRSAPNQLDLTNIIGKLPNGAACSILEQNPEGGEGWALVSSGGMQGYVSGQYLVTGEDAKALAGDLIAERATIVTEKLRMRSEPQIAEGNTIGAAVKGEKYQIERREGDWLLVKAEDIDGYDTAWISALPENVSVGYGLNEARALNLRAKVLNMYDNLVVSTADDYINIRKTPEENGISNIVGKFPGYAGAELLGEENGWYKIRSGAVEGYVKAELVSTGAAAENLAVEHASLMAIINTDALNVRAEPSTDASAWTQVTKNQRYNVLNQLDGWVQLELDTGDDADEVQGAYVSTRDSNVEVRYALQEAVEYYPAVEAANQAAAFRNQIVNFACQFVGNPYVWGGTSLTHGADCSGFTQSVLKNFGISIPRVSRDQARTGVKVTSAQMKPGDLIFYANRSGTVNHVGMYIGNGQVVNAASRRSGIRIYAWNYRTPVAIRNVIGD